jgi:o-succinylbenzoate synthase
VVRLAGGRVRRVEFVERQSVILELRDTAGAVGYGEAAPWPGFGTETVEQSLAVLRELERILAGAEIEFDGALEMVDARRGQATGDDAVRRVVGMLHGAAARAAFEGALWDLAARRAGQPLAEFLAARLGDDGRAFGRLDSASSGGRALTRVAASALLVATTPDKLRYEAERVRESGYRAAKLKLGAATLAEDLTRVAAARDGLGPEIELRGDANGAWNERQAREALEALAAYRVAYVEQPLPADAIEALARLRRDSPVRIAADESVATEAGAELLLAADAVDVVVLKPASLGGPARALAIAARARRSGCHVVFTHAFESGVGARHVLHCAAAWGDAATAHGVGTAGIFARDVGAAGEFASDDAEPVAVHAGFATVSPDAGLGIHL